MEKLKKDGKYDDYKRKKAADRKKQREAKKEAEKILPLQELKQVIDARRQAVRDRVRKHRKSVKNRSLQQTNTEELGYRTANTLGKAVKKIERVLPSTSSKRTEVLVKLIDNLDLADQTVIVNKVMKRPTTGSKQDSSRNKMLYTEIHKFYERDDISRVSPKMSDVRTYKCTETGNDVLKPTRHMVLTVREAHALFVEERKNVGKGIINLSNRF